MGHGNHWEAITGSAEESVGTLLPATVAKGKPTPKIQFLLPQEDGTKTEEIMIGMEYPETPLRYLAVIESDSVKKSNFVSTAYPYCFEGCSHRIKIEKLEPDADGGCEGIILGDFEGRASVAFFDPLFFLNQSNYKLGEEYTFSIAALAYMLRKTDQNTITITEGPLIEMEKERLLEENPNADESGVTSVELSIEKSCWLMPREIQDDFEYRGIVDSVQHFEIEGTNFYGIKSTLFVADESPFEGVIYASEAILEGYIPQAGDSIEAVIWLQGRLLD